jgi:hypothetical protein
METETKKPQVPHTAREAVAALFPEHRWHCACWAVDVPGGGGIQLTCDCGSSMLVSATSLVKAGLTFEVVAHALRNVPRKPGKA